MEKEIKTLSHEAEKQSKQWSGMDYHKAEDEMKTLSQEAKKWRRRWSGEEVEDLVDECTMPGCHVKIFSDCEYFTDDSGNIFCSSECVLEYYGIEKKGG